ncbi:cytochrome P450 [Exidia glandulosa HHB12029]|uniref:Cytochrome P450 n=1 Tax=Exidia glandulosa HHB12029 TaxID=1314781 RepID=A0A165I873_EXIGL|nr:cytochrome P450 [Exidia glandulosa HHB12029]
MLPVLVAAATALVAYLLTRHLQRTTAPPPPGPPCRPLLGLDPKLIPPSAPWKRFAEWGTKYGPVSSFHILGQRSIVINSFAAAGELLNKRASVYSERPLRQMLDVVMDRGSAVFNVTASDERHKVYRRILHGTLNQRSVASFHPMLEQESRAFVKRLANDVGPQKFEEHVRHNVISVIMRIAFGYSMQEGDTFVAGIQNAVRLSSLGATPGRWLVDYLPILRFVPSWFPGAEFKRLGWEWKKVIDDQLYRPFQWTKDRVAEGKAEQSFTATQLHENAHLPEHWLVKCAAAIYIGGADTTASAMICFFLAMSLYPDVQQKAQAEVDAITGGERLPTCKDIPQLKYLRRVMQEVLRWGTVVPLAIPHAALRDDEYNGYRIEKGATIFPNLWGMFHDPEVYPSPDTFDPDRFAPEAENAGVSPPPDPLDWAFGFGKRICPGLHFAQTSLFLNMASVLSVFDISKERDSTGAELEPNFEFTTGITSTATAFGCTVKPRSPESLSLIA